MFYCKISLIVNVMLLLVHKTNPSQYRLKIPQILLLQLERPLHHLAYQTVPTKLKNMASDHRPCLN